MIGSCGKIELVGVMEGIIVLGTSHPYVPRAYPGRHTH